MRSRTGLMVLLLGSSGCTPAPLSIDGEVLVDGAPLLLDQCDVQGGALLLGGDNGTLSAYDDGDGAYSTVCVPLGSCPEAVPLVGCVTLELVEGKKATKGYSGSASFTCSDTAPAVIGELTFEGCGANLGAL